MPRRTPDLDLARVKQLYLEERRTLGEAARILGTSSRSLGIFLDKNAIARHSRFEAKPGVTVPMLRAAKKAEQDLIRLGILIP